MLLLALVVGLLIPFIVLTHIMGKAGDEKERTLITILIIVLVLSIILGIIF